MPEDFDMSPESIKPGAGLFTSKNERSFKNISQPDLPREKEGIFVVERHGSKFEKIESPPEPPSKIIDYQEPQAPAAGEGVYVASKKKGTHFKQRERGLVPYVGEEVPVRANGNGHKSKTERAEAVKPGSHGVMEGDVIEDIFDLDEGFEDEPELVGAIAGGPVDTMGGGGPIRLKRKARGVPPPRGAAPGGPPAGDPPPPPVDPVPPTPDVLPPRDFEQIHREVREAYNTMTADPTATNQLRFANLIAERRVYVAGIVGSGNLDLGLVEYQVRQTIQKSNRDTFSDSLRKEERDLVSLAAHGDEPETVVQEAIAGIRRFAMNVQRARTSPAYVRGTADERTAIDREIGRYYRAEVFVDVPQGEIQAMLGRGPAAPVPDRGAADLAAAAGELRNAARELSGDTKLDLPPVLAPLPDRPTRRMRDEHGRQSDIIYEAQRHIVLPILEGIEDSNRDCYDVSNGSIVRKIEVSLKDMDTRLANEVRVRLKIHDSAELIKQAGGNIKEREDRGLTIGAAATMAMSRGHDLDRTTADHIKRNELPGLKTAEAWDLIQDAVYSYRDFCLEAGEDGDGTEYADADRTLGEVPSNFWTDSNEGRKSKVRNILVGRLVNIHGLNTASAVKSLQIAEKFAIGSLESSVFNKSAQSGNDQLAEVIDMKNWRYKRMGPGRTAGATIHLDFIDGFGTSWLRSLPDEHVSSDRPLYARDIEVNEIKTGSWQGHCSSEISRYYSLRDLIINEAPEPDKINTVFLRGAVPYFNSADKPPKDEVTKKFTHTCGDKRLRVHWLAGVVDIALSDETLGWNPDSFAELYRAAVANELQPGAGPFITEDQWEWIKIATDYESRLPKTEGRKGIAAVIRGAISGGGGKKK